MSDQRLHQRSGGLSGLRDVARLRIQGLGYCFWFGLNSCGPWEDSLDIRVHVQGLDIQVGLSATYGAGPQYVLNSISVL